MLFSGCFREFPVNSNVNENTFINTVCITDQGQVIIQSIINAKIIRYLSEC